VPDNDAIRSADSGPGPSDSPPDSARLAGRIDGFEQKLNSFGSELEQLKQSEGNLLKKIALILGVIGALIAIPKGIIDSVSAIHQRPQTTLDWGSPLTIHYDSKTRLLRFGFPLVFNNQGNADDTLEKLSADIHTVPDNSKFAATISDFELTLGQTESTQLPLPLTPHQPKQVHINLVLPGPFSERALSFEGERTIVVTFTTADKGTISHNYCFDLDRDQGAEILVSQDKNIRTPDCE
jgi:hypothetical protein